MQYLRQSTASQEISLGQFLDSSDGDTEENALTINNTDIRLRKHNTSTLVNKNSGGATTVGDGVYIATLDATDSNTAGMLEIYVHITGALVVKSVFTVLTATAFDALFTGTFNNLGGEAQSADHTAALDTIEVDVGKIITATITNAAGVDIAEDIIAVKADTTEILVDTGTTLPTQIDNLNDIAATEIVSNGAITTLSGAIVNVDLVDVTTTNTDMRGTDGANTVVPPSFDEIWTGTLTESYAADGVEMTPAQSLHMIWSDLRSPQQVSTTWSDFRLNNTTVAMTFDLDDAITPTKKTRST